MDDNSQGNADDIAALNNIKEDALHAILPIIDSAENIGLNDKFNFLLTAARVSDKSPSILQKASDIAKALPEDSEKLQALLDIVNEASVQITKLSQN